MKVYIILGAVVGIVIGWLTGNSQWTTYGPFMGVVLGLVVGGIMGGILGLYFRPVRSETAEHKSEPIPHPTSPLKLNLKEEELEITKSKVRTGEVNVYKEIIEEEKHVTVPVRHEELVIEKYEVHGKDKEKKDVIRIPLSEEEVVITKHPVQVGEVSISKENITEMKHIQEILKKEQAHYEVIGVADVNDHDSFEEQNR